MGKDRTRRERPTAPSKAPQVGGSSSEQLHEQPTSTYDPTSATSDVRRLEPGLVLAERYRIVDLLGVGGMGDVYRADDLTLRTAVALKVLTARDGRGTERLLDEVRLARKVSHPNVCRVHDVGQANGLLFISMEHIDGEDLASLLRRVGVLAGKRALEIGIQSANGLSAIHAKGVLHLDLKPANLMIDPAEGVKITDFGIAGKIGAGARGGTLAYMPPEQRDGSACEASDIYALGLVLYELVTGRRPFTGAIIEVTIKHRKVVPTPPSALVDDLDPRVERLILQCLEKDPALRPTSALAVAEALAAARIPVRTGRKIARPGPAANRKPIRPRLTSGRLRRWPSPSLPDEPYPVLLPYTHPQLLAGRRRELAELKRLLRLEVPILALHGASGTGKSSLLIGGLVPWLNAAGWPVAYSRYPWEPDLADRLIGDLVERAEDEAGIGWERFGDGVTEVARLSEEAPVLVLDQFEELLINADRRPARAVVGVLLAATVGRRPGLAGLPCRWLLAYRKEYHGEVVSWLSDVLADARAEGLAELDGLPNNLAGADRFHATGLRPLGAPAPGADPLTEAIAAFRAAIEAPIGVQTETGEARYPLRFAPGHAERLAKAFAHSRVEHPEAPLTPELQVVLAYRLAASAPAPDGRVEVRVPEDAGALVDEALEDHLRRALETAFPTGRSGSAQGRARALLALRELAHATGRRQEGLPNKSLATAIGEGGEQILERLAAPDTRLVVAWEHPDGLRWVLSHDRMAEAVVRLVEEEGQHGGLLVDTELLALRRFVSLESALYELRGKAQGRVNRRRSRQIEANVDALLFDETRRSWWAASRARQRTHRRQVAALFTVIAIVIGLVAIGTWRWAAARAELRGLHEHVTQGDPEIALAAFEEVRRRPDVDNDALRQLLVERESPIDLLERGLGGLPHEVRGQAVLEVIEIALPLIEATPDDPVLVASLVWALDYAPARDPTLAERARALRKRVLEPLRRLRPPPPLPGPDDPEWADIPVGTFWMGSGPGEGRDDEVMLNERPRHQVTLSPFRMLTHEVTNADYRRLVSEHEGEPELPVLLTWYEAYRYAAWLGGRLPTEAEWEYAARAGCVHVWCASDGSEAAISRVAWWVGNTSDPATSKPELKPVMQLEPNPWGLYDMLGNWWEWTADWYGEYPAEAQVNPVGPTNSDYRVPRGGGVQAPAALVHASTRETANPVYRIGCRVVLPAEPQGE